MSRIRRAGTDPVAVGLIVLIAAIVVFILWNLLFDRPPPATPESIWARIVDESEAHDLDPAFVWAIAHAESSLNPEARNQRAVGLMQLTPPAWNQVRDAPFRAAADWEENIAAAVDYLAYLRGYLSERTDFTYARLAAAYSYGPGTLRDASWDITRLKPTNNRIYQRLLAGEIAPIDPPTTQP